MSEYRNSVSRYLARGCCCTEALIRFGLELLDEEEEDHELLINAAAGLCNGMFDGGACGALTGGCMLLAMMDRSGAPLLCQELSEWFRQVCSERYPSENCRDILEGNPLNRIERCWPLILEVTEKCTALLEEQGLI